MFQQLTPLLFLFASVLLTFVWTQDLDVEYFDECVDLALTRGTTYLRAVYYNDSIYVFGGRRSFSTFSVSYTSIIKANISQNTCLDPTQNKNNTDNSAWQVLTTALVGFNAFYGSEFVESSSTMYMFGVRTSAGTEYGSLWTYNFDNNTLDQNYLNQTVPNVASYYCTAYDSGRNLIYLLGGTTDKAFVNETSFLQIYNVTSDNFITDLNASGFTQLADFDSNIDSRAYGACSYDIINDEVCYFSGISRYGRWYSYERSVLCYNIAEQVWKESSDVLLDDRYAFSLLRHDRDAWLFGGNSGNKEMQLNTIEVFNFDTKTSSYATDSHGDIILLSTANAAIGAVEVVFPGTDYNNTSTTSRFILLGGYSESCAGSYVEKDTVDISYPDLVDEIVFTVPDDYAKNVSVGGLERCNQMKLPVAGRPNMIFRDVDQYFYIFGTQTLSNTSDADYVWRHKSSNNNSCEEDSDGWELVNCEDYTRLSITGAYVYSQKLDTYYTFFVFSMYSFNFQTLSYNRYGNYGYDLVFFPNSAITYQCAALDETSTNSSLVFFMGGAFHSSGQLYFVSSDEFLVVFNLDTESFVEVTDIYSDYRPLSDFELDSRAWGSCVHVHDLENDIHALYYYGGTKDDDILNASPLTAEYLSTILVYNFNTNTWFEFEGLPTWSNNGAALTDAIHFNNYVWIVGASTDVDRGRGIIVYDLLTNETYVNPIVSIDADIQQTRGLVYFDYFDRHTKIILAGGHLIDPVNGFDSYSDITYVSYQVGAVRDVFETPAPTLSSFDTLFSTLLRSGSNELLECPDLSRSSAVSQAALVYFDFSSDQLSNSSVINNAPSQDQQNVRYVCLMGGYQSGLYQKRIICHEISNVTCDESVATVESTDKYEWTELDVEFDDVMTFVGIEYVQTKSNIVYIFNPQRQDDESGALLDDSVIKFDFLNSELTYLDSSDTYQWNSLNYDFSPPCVCYDENRNQIFVLSYVSGTQLSEDSNQFLFIFDVETETFLVSDDVSELSTSLSYPRYMGACAYHSVLDAVFYFGGLEALAYDQISGKLSSISQTTSVLAFFLETKSWMIMDVLDNYRVWSRVIQVNQVFYIMGGLADISDFFLLSDFLDTILVYDPVRNLYHSYISEIKLDKGMINIGSVLLTDNTNEIILAILTGDYAENSNFGTINTTFLSNWLDFSFQTEAKADGVDLRDASDIFQSPQVRIILLALLAIVLISVCVAWIHNESKALDQMPYFKKHKTDSSNWLAYIKFWVQVWDFLTDLNLCFYTMSLYLLTNDIVYIYLFVACAAFIVIPWSANLILILAFLDALLKKYAPYNEQAATKYYKYSSLVTLFSIFSGNFFATLELMSSGVFGLDFFNMSLTTCEMQRFLFWKLVLNILLEDFVQLVIVLAVIAKTGLLSTTAYLSVTTTVLSLLFALFDYLKHFDIDLIEVNFELKYRFDENSAKIKALSAQSNMDFNKMLKANESKRVAFAEVLRGKLKPPPGITIDIRNIDVSGSQATVVGVLYEIKMRARECTCFFNRLFSISRRISRAEESKASEIALAETVAADRQEKKGARGSCKKSDEKRLEQAREREYLQQNYLMYVRQWKCKGMFDYVSEVDQLEWKDVSALLSAAFGLRKMMKHSAKEAKQMVCHHSFKRDQDPESFVTEVDRIELTFFKSNHQDVQQIDIWKRKKVAKAKVVVKKSKDTPKVVVNKNSFRPPPPPPVPGN